ncbi:MAG: hypothetical protein SGBAC_004966 [Bacillariaceae sp.]
MKLSETKQNEDNDGEQQNFLPTLRHLLKSKRVLLPISFLVTLMALNREASSIRNFQRDQRDAQRQTVNQVQHQVPESEASTSRPTNYLLYVVTLQGVEGAGDSNIGRYDNFKRHWNIVCHQDDQHQEKFHFHTCPGHLGPKGTVKGYGLSLAYLDCFHWALRNHKEWHREHNQHNPTAEGIDNDGIPFVFLEDDARLYNSNFCYSEYRNRIWQSLPQTNSTLLMLGGHTMAFDDTSHPIAQAYQDHYYDENLLLDPSVLPQFIHPRRGFGSYGFVLLNTPSVEYMTRKMDKMLNRTFDAKGMKGFKAIDQQFHHYGVLKTVMSYPWLVYHEGGLYSNTKGGIRGEFGDGSKQYRWMNGLTGSSKNCSDSNASSNRSWEEIASEFQEHHDIVWINLPEGAVGMSLSLQVATFLAIADAQYGDEYSHILKVTDHSYAKLSAIRSDLLDKDRQNIAMYGTNCGTGVRPSHVGISETEYSEYFFPQYCKGEGYALSRAFVRCAVSQIPQSRLVSLDDAYMGVLGERCGLEENHFHSAFDVRQDKVPSLQHNLETTAAMEEYHAKQLNATLM